MTEHKPEFEPFRASFDDLWWIRRNRHGRDSIPIGPYANETLAQAMADILNQASPYNDNTMTPKSVVTGRP